MLANVLSESFRDPARLSILRERLDVEASKRTDEVEKELDAIATAIGGLGAKIAKGRENLLLLPADMVSGAVAQVRQWEAERTSLAARRDALQQQSAEDTENAARIQKALAIVSTLEDSIQGAPPPLVRDAIARLVSKVTFTFDHSRHRNVCKVSEIEVEFTPDIQHLFPSASGSVPSTPSAGACSNR
jgi:hypothetical protein